MLNFRSWIWILLLRAREQTNPAAEIKNPGSLSNRRRKELKKLGRRKHRRRLGQMLIEGVRAVEAAVAAGAPLVELLLTEEARAERRVLALAQKAGVPVRTLRRRELDELSDVATSQGILAVAETTLIPEEELTTMDMLLVLDGVQDPGNVGTLLRTAAWFGIEGVLGGPGTAGFFSPKVVRAAMGGHWDLKIARTKDLPGALGRLAEAGLALYGADLEGTPAQVWQPRRPSALILGSEAHGPSAPVQQRCTERVVLPGASGRRGVESLNVAVAAGILMYEWTRPS